MEIKKLTASIAALPYWHGAVKIKPISGGMTNRNFMVQDRTGKYFVRVGGDIPIHGIVRRYELVAAKAAASLGIAPNLLYHKGILTVFEFVEGATWTPKDTRLLANRKRVLALLKRAHQEMPAKLDGSEPPFFWVFHIIRHYLRTLYRREGGFNARTCEFAKITETLEQAAGRVKLVYAHNDIVAANFIDNGEKLWLLDWEYSGFNSATYDLSSLTAYNEWNEKQEQWLLEHYYEEPLTESRKHRYLAMKCAAALRDTLWSMVAEHYSQLALDFVSYTAQSLKRFETIYAQFNAMNQKL